MGAHGLRRVGQAAKMKLKIGTDSETKKDIPGTVA